MDASQSKIYFNIEYSLCGEVDSEPDTETSSLWTGNSVMSQMYVTNCRLFVIFSLISLILIKFNLHRSSAGHTLCT